MRIPGFIKKVLLTNLLAIFLFLHCFSQHRLVLLHPTVSNIENMVWMIENKVIDIPGIDLLGVYSSNEAYDYTLSAEYLRVHHLNYYHLQKVEEQILPDQIFRENGCTALFRKLFDESDAILFFGGPDIPAAVYGEKQNLLTVVTDANRHYFETSFFFHLIGGGRNLSFKPFIADRPDFIVRGFCLGMQTMNVAAGGTLLQDIPTECYHKKTLEETAALQVNDQHRSSLSPLYSSSELFDGIFHQISIAKSGYLAELARGSSSTLPMVLSAHHQAVGGLGSNLNVIATSIDGKIVEGLQHANFKNVVGVQFHPESASLYQPGKRFTTVPGTVFFPNELLIHSNSMNFHKLFWKDFSRLVEDSKKYRYKSTK